MSLTPEMRGTDKIYRDRCKDFAIYQFFIDKQFNERNLLIGFVRGLDTNDAIDVYLASTYGFDMGKREFVKDYLSAQPCGYTDIINSELEQAIEKNKKELGIWM
jgi:hypothetical protein